MSQINYNLYDVIQYPLITEKATKMSSDNQVAFIVRNDSTKPQIKNAVELVYNVKVSSVNTINQIGKKKKFRGRLGTRGDVKKAIIALHQGQTIDIASGI